MKLKAALLRSLDGDWGLSRNLDLTFVLYVNGTKLVIMAFSWSGNLKINNKIIQAFHVVLLYKQTFF